MNRNTVIQDIIDKKKAHSYLEIGVDHGKNFFPIKAGKKIAVDPSFKFGKKKRTKWALKNLYNLAAKYHQITSDEYFADKKLHRTFDVIFIDGLHTYKQSLQDAINSIDRLHDDGVIIMHDCNPPHESAAFAADSIDHASSLNLPGWTGEWCGDVWKTICHLRSTRDDLEIFVLDCDYGLGIITKGTPSTSLDLSPEMIDKMTYQDLEKDREALLNLKNENYFSEFLNRI